MNGLELVGFKELNSTKWVGDPPTRPLGLEELMTGVGARLGDGLGSDVALTAIS